MQVQVAEIEQEIRNYITDKFLFGRGETLTDNSPLLGSVIDSQGVIELVIFVQQRFGLTVDDEEVTTDNFASIRTIAAFIETKLRDRK